MSMPHHGRPKNAAASIRSILLFISGVIVGLMPFMCQERFDINVPSADWMPVSATHGAYYHGPAFIFAPPAYYYEFTVSEEEFLQHFSDHDYEFREIADSTYVPRYLTRFIIPSDYDLRSNVGLRAYQESTGAFVSNGLEYHRQIEDRTTQLVYDRQSERAYLYYTTR